MKKERVVVVAAMAAAAGPRGVFKVSPKASNNGKRQARNGQRWH